MKIKKILSITLLLILVTWFIYYFISHLEDFNQLSLINPIYLVALIFLFLLISINTGLITKYFLEPFEIKLKLKEWFGLSIITTFYNTITPLRGGAVTRAIYLKKKYKFEYTKFLATLAGIYVIGIFVSGFIGFSVSLILLFYFQIFNLIIFLLFALIFLLFLLIILFSPKFPHSNNLLINKFIKVLNGWNLIRKDKRIISIVFIVSIFNILITALMLFLEFRVFNIEIDLLSVLLLASISSLSILISLTPGSLGIKEAILIFTATTLGIPITESIAVSLLDRAIQMLVLFILGPIFSYILLKHKPNNNQNETKHKTHLTK